MDIHSHQSTTIKVSISEIIEKFGFVKGDYQYLNTTLILGQDSKMDGLEIFLTRKAQP